MVRESLNEQSLAALESMKAETSHGLAERRGSANEKTEGAAASKAPKRFLKEEK
jgi:hypothetical protein